MTFTPDALMIRTTDKDGRSHGGFQWPREIGAIVECPDWQPHARCGNGLHGLLDGIGDWSLTADSPDALWWIIGVCRAEVADIDGDKVKVPRGRVEFFGDFPGAMKRIMAAQAARIADLAKGNTATGDYGNASVSGKNAVAAALGYAATAKAEAGGAIMLAAYDDDLNLVAVRASLVGQNGVEAGKPYRLTVAGEFEEAE